MPKSKFANDTKYFSKGEKYLNLSVVFIFAPFWNMTVQ